METRKPAVSGMFYAGTARELEKQIEWCYMHDLGPKAMPQVNSRGSREIVAIIVPHAGYYYSGPVAAHAYKELAEDGTIDTAVILGPNHTGYGYPISVWAGAAWNTPLGDVEIDATFAHRLLSETIRADETAHIYEHSIEVQLPWLQHLYKTIRIVPIAMLAQDIRTARIVGKAIAQTDGNLVIIASTDFTHYEAHPVAMEKDSSVIEAIVDLDEEELYRHCQRVNCTMCGYGPVASAIVAAKEIQAKRVNLLSYATSGDTTGDFSRVVGYASIVIRR
ncbi:MAG: AmmeMemoRadiSam system protein B [Dehalococcoidia bacterium]